MDFPGAIIFVNNDLTPGVQGPLERQLYITESITGAEFDARVAGDPNYPQVIHENNLRVLVIRSFCFGDGYNFQLADVAIFIKAGLACIESCKFGPPGQSFGVDNLTIYELLRHYPDWHYYWRRNAPGTVQNNILIPMYHHDRRSEYPFGSHAICPVPGGRGADVAARGNMPDDWDDDDD